MRLIRLRLTNYRGIETAEVHFKQKGLTIVEGPNEVGKTSLSEAIGLIFEYMDSSKHRNVDAVRPVHCDAGPEIELEAESGPYGFIYFKRFYKKPATTLTIKQPRPESLAGREAHDRAEQILRETMDVDLWKALCIQQGEAVAQADLSKQTSLSVALDMAAGGQCADSREESLFDKVRQEFGRYFTERGVEKKVLQQVKRDQEDAREEVASLEKQIQDLDKDTLRAAALSVELQALRKQEQALRKILKGTTAINEMIRIFSAQKPARSKK